MEGDRKEGIKKLRLIFLVVVGVAYTFFYVCLIPTVTYKMLLNNTVYITTLKHSGCLCILIAIYILTTL